MGHGITDTLHFLPIGCLNTTDWEQQSHRTQIQTQNQTTELVENSAEQSATIFGTNHSLLRQTSLISCTIWRPEVWLNCASRYNSRNYITPKLISENFTLEWNRMKWKWQAIRFISKNSCFACQLPTTMTNGQSVKLVRLSYIRATSLVSHWWRLLPATISHLGGKSVVVPFSEVKTVVYQARFMISNVSVMLLKPSLIMAMKM